MYSSVTESLHAASTPGFSFDPAQSTMSSSTTLPTRKPTFCKANFKTHLEKRSMRILTESPPLLLLEHCKVADLPKNEPMVSASFGPFAGKGNLTCTGFSTNFKRLARGSFAKQATKRSFSMTSHARSREDEPKFIVTDTKPLPEVAIPNSSQILFDSSRSCTSRDFRSAACLITRASSSLVMWTASPIPFTCGILAAVHQSACCGVTPSPICTGTSMLLVPCASESTAE
mmetsp:Transcript_5364/g.8696  ORF Transcript_5364/g.8696 Transcript_5364/m.8696 type:complete len:230 (+) Transcript_5364:581-1270(+)